MSTVQPEPQKRFGKKHKTKDSPTENTPKETKTSVAKKGCWSAIAVVVLTILLVSLLNSCEGPDKNESAPASTESTTSSTKTTSAKPAPTPTSIANLAEGVDPKMGPQEWYDQEVYRANNCASQNLAFGGIPMCAIRGVDTANGGTMLVGYIDQDGPGVQDHFAPQQRRDMMVEAFAERVGQAKHEGDPRVQHVTDVRIIASGGKGLGSGWQGEAKVF